jgi:DNA-binding transcriptional MerR regulator
VATAEKSPDALKTIGELSLELGVAQHILRYWETKFPQLKPMQRAGNRRYYRPADVELARRIHRLLSVEGYTVRGVQKLLRDKSAQVPPAFDLEPEPAAAAAAPQLQTEISAEEEPTGVDVFRLIALRNRLADALDR